MELEDEDPLTLPKWPFYAGDVFLVGSAIAIAFLGGGNLTGWQVASCVIAVGLGAFLFVLPFIVEYQLRLKERGEGVSRLQAMLEQHLGGFARRLDALEQEAAGWQARLDAVAQGSEGAARRVETKIAGLAESASKAAGFSDEIAALKRELATLSAGTKKRLAELKEALPEDLGVEAAVFASLSEKVKALGSRLEAIEKAEAAQSPSSGNDEGAAAPAEKRKPRAKADPGSKLLDRAIGETGETSTPEVRRIISSGPKAKPDEEKPREAEPSGDAPEPSSGAEAAPPDPSEPLLMPVGDPAPAPRKPRRRKGQSQVLAHVLIGIGNKPFLRGSGGGLNWETGVPMDFDEIGKWSWTAPPGCGEVEVRVYRNDEDPDRGGNATLLPGQTLELKPQF